MIKTCTNDIKLFKQMSFLPSSIVTKQHKSKRSPKFNSKGSGLPIVASSSSMSNRGSSAMSTRQSYSSHFIDSLIKKYWKSGQKSRRNIDRGTLDDRKHEKLEIQVICCSDMFSVKSSSHKGPRRGGRRNRWLYSHNEWFNRSEH